MRKLLPRWLYYGHGLTYYTYGSFFDTVGFLWERSPSQKPPPVPAWARPLAERMNQSLGNLALIWADQWPHRLKCGRLTLLVNW